MGVDLFFVIYSYFITYLTLNRIDSNAFTIKDFFKKRFNRILPTYYFN